VKPKVSAKIDCGDRFSKNGALRVGKDLMQAFLVDE
jgi:hypothetical protein